ncbi:FtsL-like putative cell division protein [Pedobacter faecalis]|uniref:FtsL-like putative cell division protein n=1 Tax=Pedobacter faecalis TaxID=3041495 RepID=UPI00254B1099|nr:FtsL-like putative cell division protein [Pedobacter sp. ELA7]
MNNEFVKSPRLNEEADDALDIRMKIVPESDSSFVRKLFADGVISKEAATKLLPFLIFLSVLGMLYIANSHMAIGNIRDIDRLNKEVKELSWEYKSLKADLMFKSKLTEVAKKVDTLGIKVLTEPPKKIVIHKNEH